MTERTQKKLFLVLALVMLLVILFFSSGCEVLKNKSSRSSDSTSVKKLTVNDSNVNAGGNVSKNETKAKEANEWERTIYQYGRDTNVTNVYPSTIIYERGSGTKEQQNNSTDSSFYFNLEKRLMNAIDSTNSNKQETEKDKSSNTKGVGLITIILIGLGLIVLNKGVGFIGSKYRLVKNVTDTTK